MTKLEIYYIIQCKGYYISFNYGIMNMTCKPLTENIMVNSKKQKPLVKENGKPVRKISSHYKTEYAGIAYDLLAKSDEAKTKSHLCRALQCTRLTLLAWMRRHPEFKEAVEAGLQIGEANWRDRIAKYAFEPTSMVNNGLIKLLSSNVYGIQGDQPVALQVSQINHGDPEAELKKRGIPVPVVANEDIKNNT